ncbi:DUF4129 domain-containing protein [Rhizomonospora bruguierae]|uniref:DUF4129 domain-containing protein n=1 Tax=Rhizomonospora bruguierae TaxID=1581705 RepID=UPI001BCE4776|nr:DUF4129 domain-containing protein [Micromonospora sp. NBRC 107566]
MKAGAPTALDALRRWWPLAAAALLLAAVAAAAAFSTPRLGRVATPEISYQAPRHAGEVTAAPPPTAPVDVPPAERGQPLVPRWVTVLVGVLCVALVVAVVVAILVMLLRDRFRSRRGVDAAQRPRVSQERTAQEVVAAVDAGLVDLSAEDADPRRAVIACWVRLEQAAAAAGVPREPGDTSTDLVTRLLSGHDLTPQVLAGFAAVYREARYATHAVDDQTRQQAIAALRRLRAELAHGGSTAVASERQAL